LVQTHRIRFDQGLHWILVNFISFGMHQFYPN